MKPTITPSEILLEDYLVPMSISQNTLARALGISPRSINEIVLVYSSNQGLHRVGGLSINAELSVGKPIFKYEDMWD